MAAGGVSFIYIVLSSIMYKSLALPAALQSGEFSYKIFSRGQIWRGLLILTHIKITFRESFLFQLPHEN